MPRAAARSTDIFQDSVLLNSDSEHLNFAARQSHHTPTDMCNFYSLTKGQEAIGEWFRVRHDRTDNLPLFPGIFPINSRQSFATEQMANASLSWRAGTCLDHRSSAASRSQT
jgi:hypothetical protein